MFSRSTLVNILILSFLSGAAKAGPEPFLWYDFEESAPNTVAHDSSGNEYHGMIDTDLAEPNWDPANDSFDGCLVFNNDTAVIVPNDVLTDINDAITIEIGLGDAFGHDGNNWLFDTGAGDYRMQAAIITEPHLQIFWRAGNDTNDVLIWDLNDVDPNVFQEWNLWYFVKDETTGTMTIDWRGPWMRLTSSPSNCYFVSKTGVDKTLANVKNNTFKIGALTEHDHDFMGRMYGFGLYDYAFHFTCPPPPECAWGPAPDDGDVNVPPDANLTWRPGDYALQHKVFFGTGWEDVNSMTDPCATKNLGDELFDPGPLDLDTTYFWRIDEVNGPNTWEGRVWSFTTANYIVVDDFESYDLGDNLIYYTWCDQRCQEWGEATGAWLTLGTYPYPVHLGEKSMIYEYNTDDPWADVDYAEVWLPLDEIGGQQDWAEAGVKVLTLFFHGDSDNDTNDTEQMYVAIEDTLGLFAEIRYGDYRGEDMNDLRIQEWQRWDIALEDFSDANYAAVVNDVNLADITRLCIGFGNRREPIAAGRGIVYFDDIRLYQATCRPEYGPLADLSGDCFVYWQDLKIVAEQWLTAGPEADLVVDNIVDALDYAVLADMWLEKQLWPPE